MRTSSENPRKAGSVLAEWTLQPALLPDRKGAF